MFLDSFSRHSGANRSEYPLRWNGTGPPTENTNWPQRHCHANHGEVVEELSVRSAGTLRRLAVHPFQRRALIPVGVDHGANDDEEENSGAHGRDEREEVVHTGSLRARAGHAPWELRGVGGPVGLLGPGQARRGTSRRGTRRPRQERRDTSWSAAVPPAHAACGGWAATSAREDGESSGRAPVDLPARTDLVRRSTARISKRFRPQNGVMRSSGIEVRGAPTPGGDTGGRPGEIPETSSGKYAGAALGGTGRAVGRTGTNRPVGPGKGSGPPRAGVGLNNRSRLWESNPRPIHYE